MKFSVVVARSVAVVVVREMVFIEAFARWQRYRALGQCRLVVNTCTKLKIVDMQTDAVVRMFKIEFDLFDSKLVSLIMLLEYALQNPCIGSVTYLPHSLGLYITYRSRRSLTK